MRVPRCTGTLVSLLSCWASTADRRSDLVSQSSHPDCVFDARARSLQPVRIDQINARRPARFEGVSKKVFRSSRATNVNCQLASGVHPAAGLWRNSRKQAVRFVEAGHHGSSSSDRVFVPPEGLLQIVDESAFGFPQGQSRNVNSIATAWSPAGYALSVHKRLGGEFQPRGSKSVAGVTETQELVESSGLMNQLTACFGLFALFSCIFRESCRRTRITDSRVADLNYSCSFLSFAERPLAYVGLRKPRLRARSCQKSLDGKTFS